MKGDRLLQQFPDGHAILKDSRQWIVRHPQHCPNARRGSSYARETYLTQPETFQEELRACHLKYLEHE